MRVVLARARSSATLRLHHVGGHVARSASRARAAGRRRSRSTAPAYDVHRRRAGATAYPRCSVAAGTGRWTRARVCARLSSARSSRWSRPRRCAGRAARRPRAPGWSTSTWRVGEHGTAAERRAWPLAVDAGADAARRPRSRSCLRPGRAPRATSGTTRLAASVGVDARTSATRSSSGGVGLVADRADDRRAAGGDGADERLVRERQQVLERAAAAGDDDDVDLGVARRARCSASMTSRDGVGPCTATSSTRKSHRRPAPAARSRRRRARRPSCPAADEPDRRRAGTAAAACGRRSNRPSAASTCAQVLEPGEQLADADRRISSASSDSVPARRRRTAAWRAPRRGRPRSQAGRRARRGASTRACHRERHVGAGVAQREEHGALARAAGELGDLALDPDRQPESGRSIGVTHRSCSCRGPAYGGSGVAPAERLRSAMRCRLTAA